MKPYKKVGLFGLLLLPFTIILMMLGPSPEKIPDGYNSAIVAFEFASDEREVNELFDQLSEKEIEQIDLINYIDFYLKHSDRYNDNTLMLFFYHAPSCLKDVHITIITKWKKKTN